MQKIGLFFGSFNPVHIGHLAIAGYMREFTDLDEVWFVVSPQNPLKKKDTLLADRHRLYLVELATADKICLKPSDIEFGQPAPSYTIDTLIRLTEKYPDNKFVLIMGEDNLYTLHKWKNGLEIVKQFPLYVYPRHNTEKKENEQLSKIINEAVVRLVRAPLMEISGTFIRNNIKKGKDMSYFLHPAVWKYIEEMHFYEK